MLTGRCYLPRRPTRSLRSCAASCRPTSWTKRCRLSSRSPTRRSARRSRCRGPRSVAAAWTLTASCTCCAPAAWTAWTCTTTGAQSLACDCTFGAATFCYIVHAILFSISSVVKRACPLPHISRMPRASPHGTNCSRRSHSLMSLFPPHSTRTPLPPAPQVWPLQRLLRLPRPPQRSAAPRVAGHLQPQPLHHRSRRHAAPALRLGRQPAPGRHVCILAGRRPALGV